MFTVIALVALVASRADTRLWESVAQTEARYGPALQKFPGDAPGEEDRKYRYKDFYILVTFLHDRSDEEWYFHMDGKTPLSDRDIQFFLSMTSRGTPWQKLSGVSDMWSLGGPSIESWKAVAIGMGWLDMDHFVVAPRATRKGELLASPGMDRRTNFTVGNAMNAVTVYARAENSALPGAKFI